MRCRPGNGGGLPCGIGGGGISNSFRNLSRRLPPHPLNPNFQRLRTFFISLNHLNPRGGEGCSQSSASPATPLMTPQFCASPKKELEIKKFICNISLSKSSEPH